MCGWFHTVPMVIGNTDYTDLHWILYGCACVLERRLNRFAQIFCYNDFRESLTTDAICEMNSTHRGYRESAVSLLWVRKSS